VTANHDVLEHTEISEQADILEGATQSPRRNFVAGQTTDLTSPEVHVPAVRSIDAVDDIQERRFAGPVRTD
jgi:hypothetical protein